MIQLLALYSSWLPRAVAVCVVVAVFVREVCVWGGAPYASISAFSKFFYFIESITGIVRAYDQVDESVTIE